MCVCLGERLGVDGVTVQQQSEWNPSGWDGSREDNTDDCTHHVLDGEEACQRTISHHCSTLVSTLLTSSLLVCHVASLKWVTYYLSS